MGRSSNCIFHTIIPDSLTQGGDFVPNKGTQSEMISGPRFEDEHSAIRDDDRKR
jgi:cyclophilin family peptidyl-prolyl cis-trans isomerase